MRLVVASLLIPFTVHTRYRDTLRANQFDLNSIMNPFETSSFFSLKSLGNEQGVIEARAIIGLPLSRSVPLMIQYSAISKVAQGPLLEYISVIPSCEHSKKEGMLCLEDISYTTRSPAYCSSY